MSEMRDRIVRAMLAKLKADDDPWTYCGQDGEINDVKLDGTFDLTELACAAIAALREPNVNTKTVGYYGARFADGATIEDAGECWRQMIDAILTPSTISILTPGTLSKKRD